MLRLLIIDDEPYIVEWVYDLFVQQEQMELDIQKAYSAEEALTLLRRAKIDIVLTDIQMPGMDGITLMREIRRDWPECHVIFLTAHDEFEYAHIASKDGVRYVLKTETDEEIIRAVRLAADDITQSHWQQAQLEAAKRQTELYRPFLQRDYLHGLLQGTLGEPVTQDQFDALGFPLSTKWPVLLMIGRTMRGNDGSLLEKAHEAAAAEAAVEGCLMAGIRHCMVRLASGIGIWMLQPPAAWMPLMTEPGLSTPAVVPAPMEEGWKRMMLGMKGTLETLQLRFGNSRHSSSVFIADASPCRWEDVPGRYSAMVRLMNRSLLLEPGITITRTLPPDNPDQPEDLLQPGQTVDLALEKLDLMKALLESGQKEAFQRLFSDLGQALLPLLCENRALWRETSMKMSLVFLSFLNRNHDLLAHLTGDPAWMNLMRIDDQWDPHEAFDGYATLADLIFSLQSEAQTSREEQLVQEIHEYVKQHLSGDLSLVRLAEIVYLSPAYLSRLYKQITGTNLSDRILHMRMDTARRLLTHTKRKIYEITEDIGFDSPAYFIKSFKKATGMTPQEYRNHLQASATEKSDAST